MVHQTRRHFRRFRPTKSPSAQVLPLQIRYNFERTRRVCTTSELHVRHFNSILTSLISPLKECGAV